MLSAVAAQKSVLLAKQGHVKEARATALAWGKMVQQSGMLNCKKLRMHFYSVRYEYF